MYFKKIIFFIFLMSLTFYAQDCIGNNESYFLSFNHGYQISGIKNEDFVLSNISPTYNINFGKWFNNLYGIQIGYKGYFFKYIMDDYKHYYNFYFFEGFLSLNELLNFQNNSLWNLLLHAGPGYFYNHSYKRANICLNSGITNLFNITNRFYLSTSLSSIIGWDIYQGNWDILPSFSIGIRFSL